jgi:hypothetical protein
MTRAFRRLRPSDRINLGPRFQERLRRGGNPARAPSASEPSRMKSVRLAHASSPTLSIPHRRQLIPRWTRFDPESPLELGVSAHRLSSYHNDPSVDSCRQVRRRGAYIGRSRRRRVNDFADSDGWREAATYRIDRLNSLAGHRSGHGRCCRRRRHAGQESQPPDATTPPGPQSPFGQLPMALAPACQVPNRRLNSPQLQSGLDFE